MVVVPVFFTASWLPRFLRLHRPIAGRASFSNPIVSKCLPLGFSDRWSQIRPRVFLVRWVVERACVDLRLCIGLPFRCKCCRRYVLAVPPCLCPRTVARFPGISWNPVVRQLPCPLRTKVLGKSREYQRRALPGLPCRIHSGMRDHALIHRGGLCEQFFRMDRLQ